MHCCRSSATVTRGPSRAAEGPIVGLYFFLARACSIPGAAGIWGSAPAHSRDRNSSYTSPHLTYCWLFPPSVRRSIRPFHGATLISLSWDRHSNFNTSFCSFILTLLPSLCSSFATQQRRLESFDRYRLARTPTEVRRCLHNSSQLRLLLLRPGQPLSMSF